MDNRLFRRRSISINFRTFDQADDRFLGRLGDLSPGGFMLYGTDRIPLDKLYDLRVDYPDEAGKPRSAHFSAKAVWSGVDLNPDLLITGFRFYDLDSPTTRAALHELLHRFTVGEEQEED